MSPRRAHPVVRFCRFALCVWIVTAFLSVPAAAHPKGVFLRLDESDVRAHDLLEPAMVEDDRIRERTLAFAANVSGQAIYDWDEMITTDPTIAYRLMGSPTGDLAVQWLHERFVEMGYGDDAFVQSFSLPCVALACNAVPGVETALENVVAVLPGKDPTKWALIGGHYDTREATVGALDNTMGTATVLHLAELFKRHADTYGPFEATLVFALWDGEEWGLYGSSHFLENTEPAKAVLGLAPDAPVEWLAAMSFDMPGLNWPARNDWVGYEGGEFAVLNLRTSPIYVEEEWRCWGYGCYEDLKALEDFDATLQRFRNYQTLVHVVAHEWLEYPEEWVRVYDDAYGRSDHVPFIAAGIPGMRIQGSHDEEYPHYHRPTDTLENLALLAGGKDLLLEGIATQARAGGATLFYIATEGDIGHYDPEDPWHAPGALGAAPVDQSVPGLTAMWVVVTMCCFAALRRHGR